MDSKEVWPPLCIVAIEINKYKLYKAKKMTLKVISGNHVESYELFYLCGHICIN